MDWHWITFSYVLYLAVVSWLRPEFAGARLWLTAAAALAGAFTVLATLAPSNEIVLVVVPGLVLLAGYRLSGLLFVRTDVKPEALLRYVDDVLLNESGFISRYRQTPQFVSEFFELCYLLVYPALPVGAAILALSGHATALPVYWSVVLLAEFMCYAVLPWIQTRPPMLVEEGTAATPGPIRRFNQLIARGASIRANTIPSGHAAGALASALVVAVVLPAAGVIYFVLAFCIAAASVLGRYHYVVDSVLGLFVALIAWLLVGGV